jgi:ATP-dependent Clp protease ATP-binding subunit ClpC
MSRTTAKAHLDEGRRLLGAGDVDGAIASFRSSVDVEPGFVEGWVALARGLEKKPKLTAAVAAWRQAVILDDRPEHDLGLAESLRQARCGLMSLPSFDRVLAGSPDDVFALAGRAEALRVLGAPALALEGFDRALAIAPKHAFALRGKAAALNALHRFEEALPLWDTALMLQPRNSFARTGRFEAEQGVAHPPSTPPLIPPAASALPGGEMWIAATAREWARALWQDGHPEEAEATWRNALARAGAEAPLAWRIELADALDELGRRSEALSILAVALDAWPDDSAAWLRYARGLRAAERLEDALVAATRAVPLGEPAHLLRGEILDALGRYDQALAAYDEAIALEPKTAAAWHGKATTLARLDRIDDAALVWKEVVRRFPGDLVAIAALAVRPRPVSPETLTKSIDEGKPLEEPRSEARIAADAEVEAGRVLLQQAQYREAAEKFTRATDLDSTWAIPWYMLGIAAEGSRQYARSVRAFDEALQRDPQHLDAALRKADALRRKHDYFEALQAYEAVIARHAGDIRARVGRADTLRMLGKFDEAAAAFDEALAIDADHVPALSGKASTLSAQRKYSDARAIWQRILDKEPGLHAARRGLAHAEMAMRLESAAPAPPPSIPSDVQQSSPATQPSSVEPPRARPPASEAQTARDEFDRGRSFHKDRDYGQAVLCFQRALELDPEYAEAAFRLGLAHEDDRQFRKAIEAYERCLQLKPDHVQAATNIGEAYRKNERYKDAVKAYDRALRIRSDYLYALAGRAESMRMLGEHEQSLSWFDKALAVGPRHAFAIQGKAAALNAQRRFKEAQPLWEKALEIDPRSQFAIDGKAYCESQLKTATPKGPTEESTEETADSTTPTLDEQGRDLTALAREGRLPDVIGREMEIRAVMKTLIRRQKANPLLLGDPGVGKTAVVEGVAQRLAGPNVPPRLRNMRIVELQMGSLVAGTKYRGTFEERMKAILKEAKATPGLVVFIDEIHTLVGAGRTEGGSLDAANMLKPALARGEINVIGATTVAEYRKHFESDSALERRFQPINIEEPSPGATVELLRRVQHHYCEHHSVQIRDDVFEACVRLAVRFVPDRRLPDKALDLLDEACAEASLSGVLEVVPSMVARVLSERTGVPAQELTTEERGRLADFERWISDRVIGQPEAIRQVGNNVRLSRAGLRDSKKPRGVFLFTGPSGVGKTELAKALSDFLFPEGHALIRLDMSEYNEKFTGSRLLGAPPGYSGHGEEGQLTGPLRRRPYAVVLLDEFEKAHPDVQATFLSLFDEGTVSDADGRKVEAREAFFVITTNAGIESLNKTRVGFGGADPDALKAAALDRLKRHFRPELLNRIDEVVWFRPLEMPDIESIVRLNLGRLAERAAAEGAELSWDDEVIALCARYEADPQFGARPALRAIDELVAEPLGLKLLQMERTPGRRFHAIVRDGQVTFDEPPVPKAEHKADKKVKV